MSVVEKLAKKIKDELDIDVDPKTFVRTYAGKYLKLQGAFVWMFLVSNGEATTQVGSTYTATECIRKDRYLTCTKMSKFREIEIFAERKDVNESKN